MSKHRSLVSSQCAEDLASCRCFLSSSVVALLYAQGVVAGAKLGHSGSHDLLRMLYWESTMYVCW